MSEDKSEGNPDDAWNPGAIVEILRRQVAELEKVRAKLEHCDKTADDDEELMYVVSELQAIRQTADDIERKLRGDAANEGKTP